MNYNLKPILSFLLTSVIILIAFLRLSPVSAHTGGGLIGNYIVSFKQEPLSPFVGEKVTLTATITDKNGQPVSDLGGKLSIKKLQITQYVEKPSKQEYKTLYQRQAKTGTDGTVSIDYTFKQEGIYDVEFIWGEDEETEGAGVQLQPREPTSFFATSEALKRILLFIGIAFVGIIVGSLATFILLTTTLHPKR